MSKDTTQLGSTQLAWHMVELIHEQVHEHGSQLGEDEWRGIFAEVLAVAFPSEMQEE